MSDRLRVIAGEKKGLRLRTIEGQQTRPTLDRVKESVFSSIQFDVPGRRALDLFAGSGALGIEAISRGAVDCTFVDNNRECCSVVRANLAAADYGSRGEVLCRDVFDYISDLPEMCLYDLIFLDPPYAHGLVQKSLAFFSDKLKKDTILVAETEKNAIIDLYGLYRPVKTLSYRINEVRILVKE